MRQNNSEFFGKGSQLLRLIARETLICCPEIGIAYYPVADYSAYDKEYFNKYEIYANSEIGVHINDFRINFVTKYSNLINTKKTVCDVGIGCGQFLKKLPKNGSYGYDVNPIAVDWLVNNNHWADPYTHTFDVITFWDSLEHIPDFDKILFNARLWVFISMPIYTDLHDDLLSSKHLRKNEHFWYFTHLGLVNLMYKLGFALVAVTNKEQEYGREAISTFAFRRCT